MVENLIPESSSILNPAEQYEVLVQAVSAAKQDYQKSLQKAKTPRERQRIMKRDPGEKMASKLFAFALNFPREPVAVDALIRTVTSTPTFAYYRREGNTRELALGILLKEHLENPRLPSLCGNLSASYDRVSEDILRGLQHAKSSDRAVRALACLCLAWQLKRQRELHMAEHSKDLPRFTQMFRQSLGKKRFEQLINADRSRLNAEIEELFEKILNEYADIDVPYQFARIAERELFEVRNLATGMIAPDIEGEDANCTKLKLSDYAGKVVMLFFWVAGCCDSCLYLFPQVRDLAARMNGEPFIVLGVNADCSRDEQKEYEKQHRISWRSFHDGSKGPIRKRWNMQEIPALYILDHERVIRFKSVLLPGECIPETRIDKLMNEARHGNVANKRCL